MFVHLRFATLALLLLAVVVLGIGSLNGDWSPGWPLAALALSALGIRDLRQTRHAVLRNYPVIGHLRFLFEYIRPEVRQYFVESDTDAIPFSRQQRAIGRRRRCRRRMSALHGPLFATAARHGTGDAIASVDRDFHGERQFDVADDAVDVFIDDV